MPENKINYFPELPVNKQATLESVPLHQSTVEKSSSTSRSSRPYQQHANVINNDALHKILTVEELDIIHSKFLSGQNSSSLLQQDSFDVNSSLITQDDDFLDGGEHEERPPHSMTLDEWVGTLNQVFANRMNVSDSAAAMFKEMDESKKGYVLWGDLLDLLIKHMAPNSLQSTVKYIHHSGKFRSIQHARRETIQKIIGVATGTTFVYIIVSKFGHVGIYDDKFRLQKSYDVDIDTDPNADLDVAASDPGWITDGIWMENSKHAVYTTSLRTMHFYDASASVHYEEYRAFGFKSIPTCMDYSYAKDKQSGPSLLLFGDDSGSLTIITFHQPQNSLFSKDEVDNVQCLFWPDMSRHSDFATIMHAPNLHKDAIKGVKYLAHNNTVITVSRDSSASVLIRHIFGKLDSYIFKLGWGVLCFDHKIANSLHVLVTGSNDKIVRIWNPVVPSRPRAVLTGHRSGINDVKILMARKLVFSYDTSAVVKVWHIDQSHCLQTLSFSFPSFKVLGKEIEYGRPAFYVDTGNEKAVLATCCEHFTIVNLNDENHEEDEDNEHGLEVKDQDLLSDAIDDASQQPHDVESGLKPESNLLNARENHSPSSHLPMSPLELLLSNQDSQDSSSSGSSGWSTVRTTVNTRARVRMFQTQELEDEAGHVPFRMFQKKKPLASEDSLNVLRVKKYSNNAGLEELARDNMPFMGLQIHGLEETKIEPDLPHTNSMLQKGIKIETIDDLIHAKLDNLSSGHAVGGVAIATGQAEQESLVGGEGTETGSSTTESRRSSTTGKKATKKELLPPLGHGMISRRGSGGEGKSLPIITEKSDTQSVITENSSKE